MRVVKQPCQQHEVKKRIPKTPLEKIFQQL